jgi:transposase
MPESHRQYLEWCPSRIIEWARDTGEATAQLVEGIISRRQHPEQGYRACLGIIRLAKKYSHERLEAACQRACMLKAYSYRSVRSILEKGLDKQPLSRPERPLVLEHENIRGSSYFDRQEEKAC